MPVDRKAWQRWVTVYAWPDWRCPRCQSGVLQLDRKSIIEKETADSLRAHNEEAWDPDWIVNQFTAWLTCSKATCREVATVVGVSGVQQAYGPEGEYDWEKVYSPRLVSPTPDMISIPAKCPEPVVNELRAAFMLYWIDSGAAANRLRIALELLLDSVSIKRRKRVPGAIKDLTLHQRIVEYERREPVTAAHLMAVKWLGNTASHESGISGEMLLDAFEIVQHVLEEIFEERSRRVAKLAHKLTQEHAPKRKRATGSRKPKRKPGE